METVEGSGQVVGWGSADGGHNTDVHFISCSAVEMSLQGIHFSITEMGTT